MNAKVLCGQAEETGAVVVDAGHRLPGATAGSPAPQYRSPRSGGTAAAAVADRRRTAPRYA
jgi:hypothetical protein